MTEFVLENNLFEFNSKFYKQISGTTIDTNFAPPYACIFMDYIKTEFLKSQQRKHWLWKRFIDDIFSFTQIQRKILIIFWKILSNSTSSLDSPMNSQERKIISWM